MRPAGDDLDEIKALLTERLEEVAEAVIGQPSAETRRKKDWKFPGHGGAFLVVRGPKRGAFYSFSDDAGGGPLDLIMYGRSCGFAEAIRWARGFLGIAEDADQAAEDDAAREARARKRAEAQRQAEAEKAAKDESGTAYARSVWNQAGGLSGTAAEVYLVQARCIPMPSSRWPHEAVRYHAASRALILAARDNAGDVQAIQRVYLTPAGQKIDRAEMETRKLPAVKVTNGPTAGAAVRLPGPADGPLLLAEGPETGLSVWAATGWEVRVAMGSIGKLDLPEGRQIVVCADDDRADRPAAKLLNKAISRWRTQRHKIAMATPWAVRRFDKTDFNDLLQAAGVEAVRDRIAAAIAPPRAGASNRVPLEVARQQTEAAVKALFAAALDYDPTYADGPPPVHAIRIGVGIGKSEAARRLSAQTLAAMRKLTEIRSRGDQRSIAIAVPTRSLGKEQSLKFLDLKAAKTAGLTTAVWRGRGAPDPDTSGQTMCQNLEAVKEVQAAGLDVEKSCCRRTEKARDGEPPVVHECPFFKECAYQKQKRSTADLWFVAHELIYSEKPTALGDLALLIVDEAPWQDGLEGVEGRPVTLALDDLATTFRLRDADDTAALAEISSLVGDALRRQPDGPLSRAAMIEAGVTPDMAQDGRLLTFDRKADPKLKPTMTPAERREAMKAAEGNRTVLRTARMFNALRALVEDGGPTASGWLHVATEQTGHGAARVVRLRGRREVAKGWLVPTLLMDATMDISLVRPYWPQVQLTAEIEAETPHLWLRQVIDKTFSKSSMVEDDFHGELPDPEKNRRAGNLTDLHAVICREARLTNGRVLVVVPLAIEERLLEKGRIPSNVEIAHHNDVAGRDEWGPGPGRSGVALTIIVGWTLPTAGTAERIAEALTGAAVSASVAHYQRIAGGFLMNDGTVTPCETLQHPDPIAEAIRWQACEGGLIQTVGRPRPASRTADNPTEILLLTNCPLSLPVDELESWANLMPSPTDLMLAAGGVALEDAADAATAYPMLWPNRAGTAGSPEAARKAFQRARCGTNPYRYTPIRKCPAPLRPAAYQRAGAGRRRTGASFDPAVVPALLAWLTERLGPLAACDAPNPTPTVMARPDSLVSGGSDAAFRPEADPWADVAEPQPPVLHPPLPGEDLRPHRPPPTQAGLLGVVTGRQVAHADPYPEPGSYEPDEEDLQPVLPGTPLPAEAPRAWWFELQRRKAAVPLPDMSIGWPANHFREERWLAAVAEVEVAWNIEWQAAWVAGSRLPPAEEGTTT